MDSKKNKEIRPGWFVFCDKRTGGPRFQVEAALDGTLPIDKAASLLAMHCLVRGQTPGDFTVLVMPREDLLLEGVTAYAEGLLKAGRAITSRSQVPLSRREQEVLKGVLQSLANKEIAQRLCVSERTVKFHVSSLLAKFGVQGRIGLLREAGNFVFPLETPPTAPERLDFPVFSGTDQPPAPRKHRQTNLEAGAKGSVVRMARRQLLA